MQIIAKQFIAGHQAAAGNARFRAADATDGGPLEPEFTEATQAEVEAACQGAKIAAPAYRACPLEQRAGFLETIAAELDELVEVFVARACQETGLPEARIRGEVGRTTGQLRLFAGVVRRGDFLGVRIDHADPERKPAAKPDLRQYHKPLGPVAVFGASNFPLAFSVCGGDSASALAAGCPIVVKGHPGHPGTSALAAGAVERAIERSGVPSGVFSMLQGRSNELGAALVQHPAIKAVGFTGSQKGGMALARLGANRPEPIPVFAEMGSINPLFVLPQALAERGETIASGLSGSVQLGGGQFCTNPGVVFAIAGKDLEAFVAALAGEISQAKPGVMLHAGILSAYDASRERLAAVDGVSRIAAGESADNRGQASVYRTTLERFRDEPSLAEEVFGPTTLLVECASEAQLTEAAAALAGQLTAGIHGTDSELTAHTGLLDLLGERAGRVLVNGFPTGVEVGHAMVHGGPHPATTDSRTTSVGSLAIERYQRPVCLQDVPDPALPEPLQEANPLGLRRFVDGQWQQA